MTHHNKQREDSLRILHDIDGPGVEIHVALDPDELETDCLTISQGADAIAIPVSCWREFIVESDAAARTLIVDRVFDRGGFGEYGGAR